jgi:hypothetical protein
MEQYFYEGDDQVPESGICVYFDFQASLNDSAALVQARAKAEKTGIEWLQTGRHEWSLDLDLLREALLVRCPALAQEYAWMLGTAYVAPKVEQDHRTSSNSSLTTTVCLYIFKEDFILDQKTKIFLSHKGADKPRVRQFYDVLKELGFDPWLDEEDLSAGSDLHRGIRQGFKDSCAAVFFITPSFADERYIKTEVNYAAAEKTEKGDRFSIISLVFKGEKGEKAKVPDILDQYVWKEPDSDLQALNEILKALPIKLGPPKWRSGR